MTASILLDALLPRDRDPEPTGILADTKYSPSFVDVGTLQNRACSLAAGYAGPLNDPFHPEYVRAVLRMIYQEVRHVISAEVDVGEERAKFSTKDQWGTYTYSFEIKSAWFTKLFASGHE